MFSHIHKKAINFERVASEFMQHTDGRKHYFGVWTIKQLTAAITDVITDVLDLALWSAVARSSVAF